MKFLITGGAGYIGSTIASALEEAGHTPVILDSLITGRKEFTEGRIFYQADIAGKSSPITLRGNPHELGGWGDHHRNLGRSALFSGQMGV